MDLDEQTRRQIILAAAGATPRDDEGLWTERVAQTAAEIAAMLAPHSRPSRAVKQVAAAKVFVATITGVRREASSTRTVVELAVASTERHPDGRESVRSERTDQPDGLAVARRAQALIGHRVRLWVELEAAGADRRVRVLRYLEDLGPALEAAS